ncbi:dystroglycan-like [Dorcoceras hygrometricum]|uniref:Dystroglycan-like n=1 Tax=Dorcoceras hygrometricum TaxID=472368 RepID=A0A2Z7BCG8_9LAMI|nr:dystroglycan-like [Dorcoceras hygrometricum]
MLLRLDVLLLASGCPAGVKHMLPADCPVVGFKCLRLDFPTTDTSSVLINATANIFVNNNLRIFFFDLMLQQASRYMIQLIPFHPRETLKTDFLRKSCFRHSLHSTSTTMESVFIVNSYQINFESVLMIPDHDGMLNMFKALEANGLRGFLGCESVLYEKELEQFFDTALVQGDDITGAVSGKYFSISQARFAQIFELPTEGFVNFSEVPKDRVYDARSIFSQKGVQVEVHGKNKYMKYEFRLLNDILAKAVNVKAGSFDAVTTERFQMMTAIHFGLKVNWSKVLFNVLKDIVDRSQKKAKGFAAQIGVLLKSMPAITMGDGVPFPNAKILSMKTVNTYIATNITIDARGENVEPGLAKVAVVKRTPKSKKKSSSTDETPVEVISEIAGSNKRQATEGTAPAIPKKRRTMKNKPSPSQTNLDIVNIAQDVVPLQIIDPTPAAAAVNSPVPKRKSRKRRLILPTGSDDESIATQELVKYTDEAAIKPTDEVDIIIEQVLEETLKLGVSEEEHGGQGVDEATFADDFGQWLDDFVSRNNVPEIVGPRTFTEAEGSTSPVVEENLMQAVSSKPVTEEDMSIDDLLLQISSDMLLPSITATEITKIRVGESISINEVRERDVYLASLPRISIHDKGKAILEDDEPVRGNPAREMVELICGDIEFLVRVRDQVMVDVVEFFHSFSLNKLSNLDALRELKEKEKLMLEWAETDSLEMAVKRKAYILAKYRELLLREFLDSHRKYFAPGQPWTTTTSLVIDLLSDAHSQSLEDLLAQQKEEMAVKRKAYILAKYRELLLREFLDSHRKYFAPGQPWTTTTSLVIDLLSDAHSQSLEDLLAQQKEHSLPMEQPCASTMFDSSVDSGAVIAQFYSVAKSTCWVRPMILVNGVWTPLQGPGFWKSSCRLSLFLNEKKMPDPVIEDNFVPHVPFIEPIQYWEAAPCLIKTWRWTKVYTEIIQFSMFGCLRPVSDDVCQEIVVYNLGVERLPVDFLKIFAEGVHTDSFVGYFGDSNVQSDLVIDSDFEGSYSDAPTVYRSSSPFLQEADSFALGPAISSGVAQAEQLYYVESPESPPPLPQREESSSSSWDSQMHFDSTDIPLDATTEAQTSIPAAPVDSIALNEFFKPLWDTKMTTYEANPGC